MSTQPSSDCKDSTLPWFDRPISHLLQLTWPICVSMLSYAVYTIVDTWFVAELGTEALAAVSMGGVLSFALIWFGMGTLQAVKLNVARDRGAGSAHEADHWIHSGFRLAFRLGLLFVASSGVIAFFAPYLTETLAAGKLAQQYILIRMAAAPLLLLAAAQREALYGESESRIPLLGSLTSTAVNIGLDALFILAFGWGVPGAAFATAIAYGADLLALRLLDARRRKQLDRPPLSLLHVLRTKADPERQRALWRLGWPIGAGNFLEIGAFTLLTIIVAQVGDAALAGHQIVLQVIHFGFLPVLAMGESASILVSEALGAKRPRWVLGVAWRSLATISVFTGCMALGLYSGAHWIANAFRAEAQLHALIVELLSIAALFQIGDGFNIVARCVLRGAQDVRFVTSVTVSLTWLTTCPLAYVLAHQLGFGAAGAWWAILMEIVVVASILWIRLIRRHRGYVPQELAGDPAPA